MGPGQFMWFFKVPGCFFLGPRSDLWFFKDLGWFSRIQVGFLWFRAGFIVFHGSRSVFMFFPGCQVGFSWFQVGFYGYSRFQGDFSRFQVGFHGFQGSWSGFQGFSWFQVGFYGSMLVYIWAERRKREVRRKEHPKTFPLDLYLGPTIPLGLAGRRPA